MTFAERWAGDDNYFCNQGDSFSSGTFYWGSQYRDDLATSTRMDGGIHGASIHQGGFSTSANTWTRAWGEATGQASSCPIGAVEGKFESFSKFVHGSGWSVINNVDFLQAGDLAPCWEPYGFVNGAFTVA